MKWLGKLNEMRERHCIEKQKQEMDKRVAKDKEVAEFIMNKYKAPNTTISTDLGMDFDSLLMYLSTIKLDKHSETLGRWTVAIVFLTFVLAVVTIVDIGSKLCW